MKAPFIATLVIALTFGLIPPAFAAKGKKSTTDDSFGPTGIIKQYDQGTAAVTVLETVPGSPADGKLKKGDVITHMGGEQLQRKAPGQLMKIFEQAETHGGRFALQLESGEEVVLQLEPLGALSPTSPYDCPKTDKMVTRAADALVATVAKAKRKGAGPSATQTELLGLMATGEKKYQEAAYKIIKEDFGKIGYDGDSLQDKTDGQMVGTWQVAYASITMAEYYLLTKDPEILPALKTYTLSMVEGQDAVGMYGHKMADRETNRVIGYGQMNHPTLASGLGMLLARNCGVEVPGLDEAIENTFIYIQYHSGKGTFPYGFHGPREFQWNNNGISGLAAVCMAVYGDKEAASFFAACAAASERDFGKGHASSLFSSYWTQVGANVLGPEVTQRLFDRVQPYYSERRMWDGSIRKDYNEGHWSGVFLLNNCLPRRALVITGRDADQSLWVDAKVAEEIDRMGSLEMDGEKPEEVLACFGHPYPMVRSMATRHFINSVSGTKFNKLKEKEPNKAAQAEKVFAALFPKFQKLVESGTPLERESALNCYLVACPEDQWESRMKTLHGILINQKESDEIRAAAAKQLLSGGKRVQPHFNDILKFLLEERAHDHFAEVDMQIAQSLDLLSRTLEWDYYKNGFVTDRDLFHRAANRLMEHKRQNARGAGVRMVRFVTEEDFHRVARDLEHILKDDDKTYHSYHNPANPMEPAVAIFSEKNIQEGVEYFTDFMLTSNARWSFRMRMLQETLPKYGIHAQPVLPKIKEYKWVKVMYVQAENDGGHRFLEGFEKMVEEIENATESPPLIPLEKAIELSKEADRKSSK